MKPPVPPRFCIESGFQADPFHCSTKLVSGPRLPLELDQLDETVPTAPTARHSLEDTHVTPFNIVPWLAPDPPGFGVGTLNQADPFQFIVRLVTFEEDEDSIPPTAQQSFEETQETLVNESMDPAGPGEGVLACPQ